MLFHSTSPSRLCQDSGLRVPFGSDLPLPAAAVRFDGRQFPARTGGEIGVEP